MAPATTMGRLPFMRRVRTPITVARTIATTTTIATGNGVPVKNEKPGALLRAFCWRGALTGLSRPEADRLAAPRCLQGLVVVLFALALELLLRRPEACNARCDLFPLFGEPFFFFGHAHPFV